MINRLISSVTLTTLVGFSVNAYAVVADDVVCSNCIQTSDIGGGSVSPAKLKPSAVTTPKIKDSAVTAAKIRGNAVTTAKIKDGAVTEAKLSAAVQDKLKNEVGTYTVDGVVGTYTVSNERYIVDASPAVIGVVQTLDHTIVARLCQDKDGCRITLAMVNVSTVLPGAIASESNIMFYEEGSTGPFKWTMAEQPALPGTTGIDGDSGISTYGSIECLFTDAETAGGSSNDGLDNEPGFGLLNFEGGSISDAATCRIIIED